MDLTDGGTAAKGAGADFLQHVGQRDQLQPGTVLKCPLTDDGDIVGNFQYGESGTALECGILNGLKRGGQGNSG